MMKKHTKLKVFLLILAIFFILLGIAAVIAGQLVKNFKGSSDNDHSTYQLTKVMADDLALTGKVNAKSVYTTGNGLAGTLTNLAVKTGDSVKQKALLLSVQGSDGNQSIYAPFDGTVVVTNSADSVIPTIQVSSLDHLVTSQVSEYDYGKVHVGDPVKVTTVAGNQVLDAQVTAIAQDPVPDTKGTSQYLVTIAIGRQLLNGQSVKINLAKPTLKVPAQAVQNGNQVFVRAKGVAKAVAVTGRAQGDVFVVTTGLTKGEDVVTNPDSQLKNGMKVGS